MRDPKLFNMNLLRKWKWRLVINELGLWKDILVSKYGLWEQCEKP